MTAENQWISLKAGDARILRWVCALPNGDPVDLTNATGFLWVAETLRSPLAGMLVQKTGAIDTVQENGKTFWRVSFSLDAPDTAFLDPQGYYFQTKVAMQNGRSYTVAEGKFVIEPSMGDS